MNVAVNFSAIAGTVIMILLTIIGYFLIRLINSIDKIKDAIEETKEVLVRQDEKMKGLMANCTDKHKGISHILDNHESRLRTNENKIAILEAG